MAPMCLKRVSFMNSTNGIMLRLRPLMNCYDEAKILTIFSCSYQQLLSNQKSLAHPRLPSRQPLSPKISNRFLDIYQVGNRASMEKEHARLADEMSRGYFADISDFKNHGGKIAMANKTIIPEMEAVSFPILEANNSDGTIVKLPILPIAPKAMLICLSFRASSEEMIDSWAIPFVDAFRQEKNIDLYEVSLIDSWFFCLKPIKWLLMKIVRKSVAIGNNVLKKQVVYSFGDHYYFRKELKILNILTGYIFLVDKFGRIRWQGFGFATKDELSSLLSCTLQLLEGQK